MERIPNHSDLAVSRLPSRERRAFTFSALVRALVDPVQEAEDAIHAILSTIVIDSSTGAQLDRLGRIIGQGRGALDDPSYRVWLKARQLVNRSAGTVPELLAILRAVVPPDARIVVVNAPPAGIMISIRGAALASHDAVSSLVHEAAAGGVRLVFEFSTAVPAGTLTLDAGPGLDVSILADATDH